MRTENVRGLLVVAAAVATAFPMGVAGAASAYDFQYRSSGERAILPLQVFDDGESTYFQWKSASGAVPAILVETDSGPRVVSYSRSGPYVVVSGVARGYRLQFGSLVGSVEYRGPSRPVPTSAIGAIASSGQPVVAVATAVVQPPMATQAQGGLAEPLSAGGISAERSEPSGAPAPSRADTSGLANGPSAIVPFASGQVTLDRVALDAIKRAFQGQGTITSVTIVGRDDPVSVDGLARARAMSIRAAAIRAGAPPTVVTVREGLAREGESPAGSDITVVRSAAALKVKASNAEPESVEEAVSLIQRGLRGLVRMGRISAEWADNILAALKRVIDGDELSSARPERQGYTKVVAHSSAGAVTGYDATLYGPSSGTVTMWAMLPLDKTAQQGLRKWASTAGVEVVWEADVDYPISKPILVRGTAKAAFDAVRQALEAAPTPLTIEYFPDRVVVRNLQQKGLSA